MIHEAFQELIALCMYGEVDEEERTRLERHLVACADCTRYAEEIESGLGAVARAAGASADPELPADWTQRLREATEGAAARRRLLPWLAAAASFAAGVIATGVIARGPAAPAPAPAPEPATPSTWDQFHRQEPPPIASTRGQLARLSEYLRR